MRLSRPCYDKPWRCPGWAGGGMKFARRSRCDNGRLRGWNHGEQRWPHLTFHRCDTCDVVTWPFVTRWLDPRQWQYVIGSWWRYRVWNWCQDLRDRWKER